MGIIKELRHVGDFEACSDLKYVTKPFLESLGTNCSPHSQL